MELLLALAEEEKDWQQAEHWNRLLLKIYGKDITPDLERYHVYAGMEKMESGDLSEAESEFNKAIKISTESALPHLYLETIQ